MSSGKVDAIYDALMNIKRGLGALEFDANVSASSILSAFWEESYVKHLRDYDQTDLRGNITIARPFLSDSEIEFHSKNIQAALDLIAKTDKEMSSEINDFVTHRKIFHGRVLRGDTSNISFGAMWLRVPEPEDDQVGYWIEHIVHEVSHMRLELFMNLDCAVLNPNTEKKFRAPIRDEPRPMRGIFHGNLRRLCLRGDSGRTFLRRLSGWERPNGRIALWSNCWHKRREVVEG